MNHFDAAFAHLATLGCEHWRERLAPQLTRLFTNARHGDMPKWEAALAALPSLRAEQIDLTCEAIRVAAHGVTDSERQQLRAALLQFSPWRKGPFDLHGVLVDSEWQSQRKWARVQAALGDVRGKHIIDVGCGNGYYAWRMLGAGAASVVGVDPTLLFYYQHRAVQQLLGEPLPFYFLPLAGEALPAASAAFDCALSMGVLSHRRSPLEHLMEMKALLKPGGRFVLETLVIEGGVDAVLLPAGRYAKMRNVWFIPSAAALANWLRRLGFIHVEIAEVSRTSTDEQRATPWMTFESLRDFLDPNDDRLTVEGHPAPRRALLLAQATSA